ncbi:MAG: hypothetical protein QOI98_3557 [Solirubrobacteraceae bacterium]|nr:hypothetical protein [Solirubrobacteraceae bacterium]
MAWKLEGSYMETCICETACPCTVSSLSLPADQDHCDAVLAFHVKAGDVEGTDVSGTGVVLFVHSPQALMSEGNWSVGVIVDSAASDEQAQALGRVFGGELGGPPELLGPLLAENLGVERASFELVDDGLTHTLRVGDSVDVEIVDHAAPESTEPTMVGPIFHPAAPYLSIATAKRARVSGFGREWEGKTGSAASFSWAA